MLKCNRYLHIGSRLISWKLRQNCLIATSSCSYSTECSQQNGADVIYDIVISGGGMVGSAMAAALGRATVLFTDARGAGFYLGFNFRGCNPKQGVPSLPAPFPLPTPSLSFPPGPPLPLEVGPLKTS